MPKTTLAKAPSAVAEESDPTPAIHYPPEILAIKKAREDVLDLKAIFADNARLAAELERTLELELGSADLRNEEAAVKLAALQTWCTLAERRGVILAADMERLLAALRTRIVNARSHVFKAARAVAKGRADEEWNQKRQSRSSGFQSEMREASDRAAVNNHHKKIVSEAEFIGWEQPAQHAVETARIVLNLAEKIFIELPDYQTAKANRED